MEAGETDRDAGAYMFSSHGPGKAAAKGPEQTVSCQHDCALQVVAIARRLKKDEVKTRILQTMEEKWEEAETGRKRWQDLSS